MPADSIWTDIYPQQRSNAEKIKNISLKGNMIRQFRDQFCDSPKKTTHNAVVYADSDEMYGFTVRLPLYNLLIKKDAQGKGIAGKLMRRMLQLLR